MTEPPVRGLTQSEFRIGQTFGRAWKLFSANVWTFVIVTAISELPARAQFLWTSARREGEPGLPDGSTTRIVIMLLTLVLILLGQAAFMHMGFQTLRRQPANLPEAVQDTVARSPSIL